MALEQNVATRVTYKAHSTGDITSNTQPDLSTDPGSTGGQVLRRVSSSLALSKETYQSDEVRTDRQIADFRHGVKRVQGDIMGDLGPGTWTDFIEAGLRCTKVATFNVTETDITSLVATNATAKLTLGSSDWATENFRVGDPIRIANASVAANNRDFLIIGLSGADATVYPAPTDMTADTSITITRLGNKMTIPTSGHVSRKFLIEHYHQDVDVTQLFSECRVNNLAIQLPATGLAKITVGMTGRDMTVETSGTSPFFASPTAAGTDGLTAAVNGVLAVNGEQIGIITGLNFTHAMQVDAPAVVGQNIVADILLGRSVVTGQMTALFQDETLLNYFVNETEVDAAVMLTTTSSGSTPGMSFYLPRIKFGGSDISLQGDGSLPITLPFQALIKPTTTGYDQTTLNVCDWTA
jgi:hypothetical protein